MTPTSVSRRSFLKTTAASVAALSVPAVNVLGANETLNVGCIGTGGRCRKLMESLVKIPNVRIAAVCDIYDVHLDLGKKLADSKAFATKQYKELLARKDIDAVLIGSPDHWHVPMTVDACAAEKDVYVEKPLTHSPEEGKAVIEAQNKHKRIVQVGTQQRSMPHIEKARELIKKGRIGKVYKVHMTWTIPLLMRLQNPLFSRLSWQRVQPGERVQSDTEGNREQVCGRPCNYGR
jgi:predicted dehydrogenase